MDFDPWFCGSWWQHASNLASYEQQDAHEFFISMLDGIHEKVENERRKPQSQGKTDFYFFLRKALYHKILNCDNLLKI